MDYEKMTILELRKLAKEKHVKSPTTLSKAELIDALSKIENETTEKDSYKTVTAKNEPVSAKTVEKKKKHEETVKVVKEKKTAISAVDDKKETEAKETAANSNINRQNVQESAEDGASKGEITKPSGDNINSLDSGETKEGILEVMPEGYGFIRCDNYLPGENDVYVSPAQIRRFNLKTGDIIIGNTRIKSMNEKFSALLYIKYVNGFHVSDAMKRPKFEELTPIFPNKRIRLETEGNNVVAMRMVDLIAPIGKGQRGMIVSQPKAGKTTLLKQIASALTKNNPEMYVLILLIDERPEEVTDMKDSIKGDKVEIIYSTFDEAPENHKRVSEMVIERAKRLVEHKQDVIILLDSITRLARAYNLTVASSGRTLSGGLDPTALHMPKKFFGAARNMREGGSLTILATALVETGSRMDDVVFEEFKGTGNMELVLDRSLSEKRIFPAIDLEKSSTRRDDLLFTKEEAEANLIIKRTLSSKNSDEGLESIIKIFKSNSNNRDTIAYINKLFGEKPPMSRPVGTGIQNMSNSVRYNTGNNNNPQNSYNRNFKPNRPN